MEPKKNKKYQDELIESAVTKLAEIFLMQVQSQKRSKNKQVVKSYAKIAKKIKPETKFDC